MSSFISKVESLYPHLPVWAQNAAISAYGLSYRRERLGGSFADFVTDFRRRDRWPRDAMDQFIDEALRTTLLHAFDTVDYYQRRWNAAGITRQDLEHMTRQHLHRLPITRKLELRSDPNAFVSSGIPLKQLHRYNTSGSTGTPVTCVCTSDGHRMFIAAREARSFGWAGSSIRKRRSMLGGRKIVRLGAVRGPFHRINWTEDQIYLSAHHISPNNARLYADALNRFQPQVMTGYAQSHYLLARMFLDQGLKIDFQPDALILGSEKLTAEMKAVLKQVFHARAYEEYGSIENCVLATECSEGRLHISSDFGVVEVLDDNDRPVPAGSMGRIVCTGLLNRAQPLVRYELGDRIVLSREACACGRNHLPVIEEVLGRLEDVLVSPDGRVSACSHRLYHGLPNVLEAQLVQERLDRIRVRVVRAAGFQVQDEQAIRKRIQDHLGAVEVVVEATPELKRTERGKFRSVISQLPRTETIFKSVSTQPQA